MAAPSSVTISDITGSYIIVRPWHSLAIRKALKVAPPICLKIKHDNAASPQLWTVTVPGVGPMKAHDELQPLDFTYSERKNPLLGTIRSRAEPMEVSEIQQEYLREGWCEPSVMWAEEMNEKEGLEGINVWGFMMVEGERRVTRKTSIKSKKGDIDTGRVVHDFKTYT